MNKAEFIDAVAAKAGLSKKDAKGAVDAVLDTITETLVKKESVSFIGFGTFSTAARAVITSYSIHYTKLYELKKWAKCLRARACR